MRSSGGLMVNRSSRPKTLGLPTSPSTETCPAFRVKSLGLRRDGFLVGRELVEIIVMGDVFQRGFCLVHVKAARIIGRSGLGHTRNHRRADLAAAYRIEPPISQSGGHRTRRQDSRPDEIPPVEINSRDGNFIGGYFVFLFHRADGGSISADKLTENEKLSIRIWHSPPMPRWRRGKNEPAFAKIRQARRLAFCHVVATDVLPKGGAGFFQNDLCQLRNQTMPHRIRRWPAGRRCLRARPCRCWAWIISA